MSSLSSMGALLTTCAMFSSATETSEKENANDTRWFSERSRKVLENLSLGTVRAVSVTHASVERSSDQCHVPMPSTTLAGGGGGVHWLRERKCLNSGIAKSSVR